MIISLLTVEGRPSLSITFVWAHGTAVRFITPLILKLTIRYPGTRPLPATCFLLGIVCQTANAACKSSFLRRQNWLPKWVFCWEERVGGHTDCQEISRGSATSGFPITIAPIVPPAWF